MIDPRALEEMVDRTLAPYRGVLDEDALEEMRTTMLILYESHPEMSRIAAAALPNLPVDQSGERAEDGDADGRDGRGRAGGQGA